jgi:hypothetical protein
MSDDIEFAKVEPEVQEAEQDINQDGTTEETLYDDDQPDAEASGQDETAEDDDSEELEFDGKAFKLPKDIAEGVKSMRKDYTEKTMTLAEQRKSFELEAKFHNENINDIARVVSLNEQINQYDQVDWNGLSETDPVLWQKLFSQRALLERQRNQMVQEVTHKKQLRTSEMQQEIAKQIEASDTVLKREIKEWSPELEAKLQKFAVSKLGFDDADVKKSKVDPRLYKLLYMAHVGEQMLAKQANKPKIVQSAKPVTNLTAKGAKVTRDPTQMSDAEFAAWRRKQIQKRGA